MLSLSATTLTGIPRRFATTNALVTLSRFRFRRATSTLSLAATIAEARKASTPPTSRAASGLTGSVKYSSSQDERNPKPLLRGTEVKNSDGAISVATASVAGGWVALTGSVAASGGVVGISPPLPQA